MRLRLGEHADAVERRAASLAASGAAGRIFSKDATFWGGDAARQRSVANRLGWLGAPAQMRAHVADLSAFARDVREAGFRDAVVLGMGGSSLAPEVLARSFGVRDGYPRLHVLDTTDPGAIEALGARIEPGRTLFFVSSKSGTTIEATSLFAHFWEIVRHSTREDAGAHFAAITDAGTPLEALARERGFRRTFVNAADIGGRYSALSYFGLVPAAVAGVDIGALLERGATAAEAARQPRSDALTLGAALGELALTGRSACTFFVAPEIASFGLWAEQLIAESTGKEGRGILPVVAEPPGSPAHYGRDRLFVQLRTESGGDAGWDALVGALAAEGHPAIVIDLDGPYDLGRAFFDWELAVAIAGQALGINPFDEPNVQESKDNTARVLSEFAATGALDAAGIDGASGLRALEPGGAATADAAAAVERLLAGVGERSYFAITAYAEQTPAMDAAFAAIRADVRDASGAPTTLGYGPRYLHSTGQLHKGGPPTGVFLQVTASPGRDVAVPGEPYTFGQLQRAQAIGDLQALHAHGLPALRVHLGTDIEAGLAALRVAVREALAATPRR